MKTKKPEDPAIYCIKFLACVVFGLIVAALIMAFYLWTFYLIPDCKILEEMGKTGFCLS